jgi:hypothetical protein
MKRFFVLLCLLFLAFEIFGTEFHSTVAGGWWMDPDTWQSTTYPGPDDDVYIHGIVFIVGENSCHDLHIIGADSMLKAGDLAAGTINVLGDLTSTGWVSNSASYNLTVNLWGNLSINYHFVPQTFNWQGSGNRTLTCHDSYQGIKTRGTTTIAATIDTIFAASDIYFAPGGTSTPLITGNGHYVVLFLYDPVTRTSYDLYSRSCRLDYLKIVGNGTNTFNFNNDSALGNVNMANCDLQNLQLTGTHMFENGCTITGITNNGAIYNSPNGTRSLTQYGQLVNNGQIGQAPYGYSFSLYSYGSITNNGLFNPSNLYLRGGEDRILQSTAEYPFKATSSLQGETGLGNIYAGTGLYFTNIQYFNGPFNLKAYSMANEPRTVHFNNVRLYGSTITGMSNSVINGTDFWVENTPLTALRLEGVINFSGQITVTDVISYATLQNSNSGNGALTVNGDFVNNGTVRNNPSGYSFTVNAWDDVRNYGTWTAQTLNLYGDDSQEMSFGTAHPYSGQYFYDLNNAGGIYVVEDDLVINASYMDLNGSTLYLNPGGWNLNLNGTHLTEASIVSDLGNELNMASSSKVSSVSFQSITNAGNLDLASNTQFSGDLVNGGIVQNREGSFTLTVANNFTNNATVRNNPNGYVLNVTAGGSVVNNGSWNTNNLTLSGSLPQMIHFPPSHPFSGNTFYDTTPASHLYSDADLYFLNTGYIDTNGSIWQLDPGNINLTLDNSTLAEADIHSTLGSVLTALNGGYLSTCSFQSVTFAGTVNLLSNATCSGNVVNNGTIQNHGGSYNLYAGGSLTNNGTLRNNPSGYNLVTHVAGNVINNGVWSNYYLYLNGASDQTIHFPSGFGFTGAYLNDTNASSAVIVDTNTYFTGTYIDLNLSPWIFTGGYDLYLDTCYLADCQIQSDESTLLSMVNGGSVSNTSFQSITWTGTLNLISNTTVSNYLVNTGTVQNLGSSYTIYVLGDLNNQGLMRSNPSGYHLYLNCSQNITNTGTISAYQLSFAGAAQQAISSTGSLMVSQLIDTNAASPIKLLTDLPLTNTGMDLNGATVILNDGTRVGVTLSLSGGYLTEAVVTGGNGADLTMGGNAYLSNVTFDDIIFNGTVLIGNDVYVNNLSNNATVMNWSGGSSSLGINGRLDNNAAGIMANNSYVLNLNLYGDVYNYGQLRHYDTFFRGSGDQSVYQDAAADTIRAHSLRKQNSSGTVIMLTDLTIKNCYLDLNSQSLQMQSGRTPHNLYMYGSYITNTNLQTDSHSLLFMASGAYISSGVTGGDMTWDGEVRIAGSVTVNSLANNGTIVNYGGNNAYLYVNGLFDNNGAITEVSGYGTYLYLYGDLYDRGVMSNRQIYFNGTATQNIYQDPSAAVISCQALRKTAGTADLVMLSDLRLQNCYLDLNGRNLAMQSGGADRTLNMSAGYITATVLYSPGNAVLDLDNGCYLNSISGGNLTFEGNVRIAGNCTFESVVNNAYTRNLPDQTVNLYLNGNLVNNGTFFSESYPLYLRVMGNITNNGTLANRRVYLTGTLDQAVYFNGSETIEYLVVNSNIGNAAWYHDGLPSGLSGISIDLAMSNPNLYGTWQPYVGSTNTWGRIITISPVGTLNPPQNLMIMTDPGGVKLSWDQVAGATSYSVYASTDPQGGFAVLLSGVTDPDPGDGTVEQVIPATAERRFFKVTANN